MLAHKIYQITLCQTRASSVGVHLTVCIVVLAQMFMLRQAISFQFVLYGRANVALKV